MKYMVYFELFAQFLTRRGYNLRFEIACKEATPGAVWQIHKAIEGYSEHASCTSAKLFECYQYCHGAEHIHKLSLI